MKKVFSVVCLVFLLVSCNNKSWRDASRVSTGIAPLAKELKEDIVLVYYARAFSWRGYFGVHPWIAWKKVSQQQYNVAQVTSWNIRRSGSAISLDKDLPDRKWFDSKPELLYEARGPRATVIIDKIPELLKAYPFKDRYRVWPGPNSNTFIAYLLRNIEELDIELPAHAVGKDYLGPGQFLTHTASNTGFKLSLYGLLGMTAGLKEGLELNLFGLHFGLDLWPPALKLPIAGRLGFKDR